MHFTKLEVSNLIQEVEKAFTAHLAKAEEEFNLAKSEGESIAVVDGSELAKAEDEAKEKEDAPAKEKAPESDEAPAAEEKDAAPAADAQAPAAPAAPEAPAADAEAPAADAAPAAPAADGEAHDYDDEDMAAMVQMYQGMSRGELKAHHDAIKQCLDSMGMEKCGSMAQAAAPAAPEAAMAKSEESIDISAFTKATQEVEILKSEVSVKETKIVELQKSLDTVTEILTKMVKKSVPAAKAVTKLEAIAKSEVSPEEKVLSKSEIHEVLKKKTMETTLSKSDREAINAYYGSGQVSATGISHLLK